MPRQMRRFRSLVSFLPQVIALGSSNQESEWTPRSKFWEHIRRDRRGLWEFDPRRGENVDKFYDFRFCINRNLIAVEEFFRVLEEDEEGSDGSDEVQASELAFVNADPSPSVIDSVEDVDGKILLVEIQSAITPYQAETVKALSDCAREFFSRRFEHREFHGGVNGEEIGGNEVTFINILLQIFLPRVAAAIQRTAQIAAQEASWTPEYGFPDPSTLGLRTSEHLSYKGFKNLGSHSDTGSIYTVLFALSDSKHYEGGEFYIRGSNGRPYFIKLKQHSAIVFLSEYTHGVTDIGTGHRRTFANELWVHEDTPFFLTRAENEMMELFEERTKGMDPAEITPDLIPERHEVKEWLREQGREIDEGRWGNENARYEQEEDWYEEDQMERGELEKLEESLEREVEQLELKLSSNKEETEIQSERGDIKRGDGAKVQRS
ncbi:hypothetical protein ACHAWF_015662 [Thalassiosira exigua]